MLLLEPLRSCTWRALCAQARLKFPSAMLHCPRGARPLAMQYHTVKHAFLTCLCVLFLLSCESRQDSLRHGLYHARRWPSNCALLRICCCPASALSNTWMHTHALLWPTSQAACARGADFTVPTLDGQWTLTEHLPVLIMAHDSSGECWGKLDLCLLSRRCVLHRATACFLAPHARLEKAPLTCT